MTRLQHFAVQATGGTVQGAATKAHIMVGQFVQQQAFIEAVDDVFFLAAIVVLISVIPVFFLKSVSKDKSRSLASME